jgi:Tol biopolymer transport system component
MQKALKSLTFILIAAMLLSACGNKAANAGATSVVDSEAFTNAEVSGGESVSEANALTMMSATSDNVTTITIKFVAGSRYSSDTIDETPCAVPTYRAYFQQSPARLVVEFPDLAYSDYTRDLPGLNSDFFAGMFYNTYADGKHVVTFQLQKSMLYKIETTQGQLAIKLKEAEEQPEAAEMYYVTANAMQMYIDGTLPSSIAMTPVLCDEATNTVLISAPFKTSDEAETFAKQLTEDYDVISADKIVVVSLTGNAMPSYDSSLDYKYVLNKQIVKLNGQGMSLPVIMPDGLYLCTSPDGSQTLFSKQLQSSDDSDFEVQELWLVDANGKQARVTAYEFATIDKAEFSPDGKKLAILERSSATAYLYVYNFDSGELLNLGEEGFGTYTSTFVWDNIGNTIYAISGTDEMELHKYDFSVSDETKRHAAVEDLPVLGSELAYAGGYLYFTDITDNEEYIICRINPEGGVRSTVTTGMNFRTSNDGRLLAILDKSFEADADGYSSLRTYNLETGEETMLVPKAAIYEFEWENKDSCLFFIESDEFDVTGADGEGTGDTTDTGDTGDAGDTGDDVSADATDAAATTTATATPSSDKIDPEDAVIGATSSDAVSGGSEEESYAFQLMMYDFETKASSHLLDMISSEIFPAPHAMQLYLQFLDSTGSEPFRATYLLDIAALTKDAETDQNK